MNILQPELILECIKFLNIKQMYKTYYINKNLYKEIQEIMKTHIQNEMLPLINIDKIIEYYYGLNMNICSNLEKIKLIDWFEIYKHYINFNFKVIIINSSEHIIDYKLCKYYRWTSYSIFLEILEKKATELYEEIYTNKKLKISSIIAQNGSPDYDTYIYDSNDENNEYLVKDKQNQFDNLMWNKEEGTYCIYIYAQIIN